MLPGAGTSPLVRGAAGSDHSGTPLLAVRAAEAGRERDSTSAACAHSRDRHGLCMRNDAIILSFPCGCVLILAW